MRRLIPYIILSAFLTWGFGARAQCPTNGNTQFVTTDEVCFGANDGTITITFTDGVPPYSIALIYDLVNLVFYIPGFDFAVTPLPGNSFQLSGLPPGIYIIRVNCSNGSTVNVGDPAVDGLTHVHAAPEAPAPVATAATDIACTAFTANWSASANASGYRLDVASDVAFTNILPGYDDVDAGNVTSYPVTGLTEGTDYYYRVRSYRNACPPSTASNIILAATAPLPVLQTIVNPATDQSCEGEDYFVSLDGSESGVAYEIFVDGVPSGIVTAGTGSALNVGPVNALAAGSTYALTVQATNGVGCSRLMTGSVSLTINPVPAMPVAGNDGPVCEGGNIQLTTPVVAGASYQWSGPAGFSETVREPLLSGVTPANSGAYQVAVTVLGCTSPAGSTTVTVNPTPNLLISDPSPVCTPATVDLTAPAVTAGSDAGALSYWQDAGATVPLAGAASVSVGGTYYIRLQSAAGCVSIGPVTAVINATPNLVIANPSAVCAPTTVDLTAPAVTAGSDAGTLSYWQDAAATLPLANPSAVAASGTYYIRLATAAGCAEIEPVVVTINPQPSLVISNPAAVCAPATVNLTAPGVTAGSDPGTLSYWLDAAASLPLANPSSVAASGTYYIRLENASGCDDIGPVIVTINAQPNLLITDPAAVCAPATVDLTAPAITVGSDAGVLSYWQDAAATLALANPSAVAASGTYYIRLQSAAGCSDIKPVLITVNPQPNLIVNNPPAICAPGTVNLTAPVVTAGSDPGSLSYWQDAGASVPLANPAAVAASGTYYIRLQSATGCSMIRPVTVTVNPQPNLVIADPAPVCAPATVNLTAPAVTAGSDPGTLSYWLDAATTLPLSNPSAVAVSGTYYIRLQSAAGCTDLGPVTVTVNAQPNLLITNPAAVCVPGAVDLTNPAVTAGSDAGSLSYWRDAAATLPLADPSAVTASGIYYIHLQNAAGCSVIQAVAVTVNPQPNLVITNPAAVCSPATVNLTAPAVTAGSDAGTLSYWQDAAASIPLASPSAVAASGTYYIRLESALGCSSIQPVQATITATPPAPVAGSNSPVCEGDNLNLSASDIPGASYSWAGPAGFTSALQNPVIPGIGAANAGLYSVTASIAGCTSAAASVNVEIRARPTASISGTGDVCAGEPVQLTVTLTGTAPWTVDYTDGSTVATISGIASSPHTFTINPLVSATYTLVSVSDQFCAGNLVSGSADVTVRPAPNVSLTVGDATVLPGAEATIPVSVEGFVNLSNIQFTLTWDPSEMTFNRVGSTGLNGLTTDAGQAASGFLQVTWTAASATDTTLADGLILLQVVMNASPSGCLSSAVDIDQSPTALTELIIADELNCRAIVSVNPGTVQTGPLPPAPVLRNVEICQGSPSPDLSVNPDATPGTTVNWYADPGASNLLFTGNPFNPAIDTNIPQTTLYYVAQSVPGCGISAPDSVSVRVIPAPAAAGLSSSDPDLNLCSGDLVALTASPGGEAVYEFYLNGVLAQSGGNSVYITNALSDLDSVSLTVYNALGCFSETPGLVFSVGEIVIAWDSTRISGCGAGDGEIVITGITGGSGDYSLSWTGPNGFTSGAYTIDNLPRGIYRLTVTDNVLGCTEMLEVEMREPVDFTISYTVTDVTAIGGADGTIDLTLTGGSGNFGVLWAGPDGFSSTQQDIAGLRAGLYTATVTDNTSGCTDAVQVQISQPGGGLVLNALKTDVTTCGASDGTINLLISGGSGSYGISWTGPGGFTSGSQNLTGLREGLYIATVTDNISLVTAQWTVQIMAPDSFVLNVSVSDIRICAAEDGAVDLDISGGSGNFDIRWTDLNGYGFSSTDEDISALAAGVYKAVVTDRITMCRDSITATVTRPAICDQPCQLHVEATTNNTTCADEEDGAAVINIISGGSGNGNYYVSLDTGRTFIPFEGESITAIVDRGQGSYLYIVKDSVTGCLDTTVANIGVAIDLVALIDSDDPGCALNDGRISFSLGGGLQPYEVRLVDANGVVLTQSGAGFVQFRDLTEGNYYYEITEQSGCSIYGADSIVLIVNCSSGCTALLATASEFEDATCASLPNGKARVVVSGGSSPYEYTVDGVNWIPFISGNKIDRLPGNGTYNIAIRQDSLNAACRAEVPVTINGPAPIVLESPIITVTPADCNVSNGVVKIGRVSGGQAPYDYQINGNYISLPADSLVGQLRAAIHTFRVIDDVDCPADFSFSVISPGSIIASAEEIPVSCSNIELKAGIRIQIDLNATDVSGPYQAIITPRDDPFAEQIYSIPDAGIRTVMGLDRGFYEVEVRSVSGTGCTFYQEIHLNNGPYPVDFRIAQYDSIVPCRGSTATISIDRVSGDPNEILLLELLRADNSIVESHSLAYTELVDGYLFSSLLPGSYFVRLSQNQPTCADISTSSEVVRISEPPGVLGFEVLESGSSYPDLPTGFIEGNVLPSGGDPYLVRIELVESYTLELNAIDIIDFNNAQPWRLVTRAGDNITYYPVRLDTLWPGAYEIRVQDSYGCEILLNYEIERDSTLFIPNVFTPNGDGYNDEFFIRNLPETGTRVLITNRWGKTVFESQDYTRDKLWDGGEEADGVYFYRLSTSGGKTYTGWLELWRGGSP
jgi:gliding motility-associated-like protein